ARVAPLLVREWRHAHPEGRPVLGVPEGPYLESASPEGLAHFREVCRRLADAGYRVESVDAFPDFEEVRARHDLIVAAEAARVHEAWYPRYGELYQEKTAELIRRGRAVSDADLDRARRGREKLRAQLDILMNEHQMGLWISPAAPGPAPEGLGWTGDPVMNLPWTQAGLPTLGLPSGTSADGLPLGLQLAGRWYEDEALLLWAGDLDKVLA
ncbi:MAG TPA: amidase family protein, partial [Thermoanaerobaculia bacterium]